jgi:hypothetical protein
MAQTSAGRSPIPPADKDDSEDVAWALSTAEAMHARGDAMEALKWLRRAAEAAAESSADDRALQIAKAAADLASVVGPTSHMPPPPPAPVPQAVPSAPLLPQVTPAARPVHPTQPTQVSRSSAPAPLHPQAQGQTPRAPAIAGQAPLAARATAATTPSNVARRSATGRRSRPDVVISRPPDEQTQQMEVQQSSPASPSPAPAARRRGRASKPAYEETTGTDAAFPAPAPQPTADVAPPTPIDPGIAAAAETPTGPPAHPSSDDMDAWPTQAMGGDALDSVPPGDEQTRIGVPAYKPGADGAGAPATDEEPPFHASQAVRVIVWRTSDGGVRIAPQGTSVSAISVEAILVALDPNADLAAWLTGK